MIGDCRRKSEMMRPSTVEKDDKRATADNINKW